MVCLVMKFGGMLVGFVECICYVVDLVKSVVDVGNEVVVVVLVMVGEIDWLINLMCLVLGVESDVYLDYVEYDLIVLLGE